MSDCCGDHNKDTNEKDKTDNLDRAPKSFVGKYLYNLGKKEHEREAKSGKHKGGCC